MFRRPEEVHLHPLAGAGRDLDGAALNALRRCARPHIRIIDEAAGHRQPRIEIIEDRKPRVPPGFVSVTGYNSDSVAIGEIGVQAAPSVLTYSPLLPQ